MKYNDLNASDKCRMIMLIYYRITVNVRSLYNSNDILDILIEFNNISHYVSDYVLKFLDGNQEFDDGIYDIIVGIAENDNCKLKNVCKNAIFHANKKIGLL